MASGSDLLSWKAGQDHGAPSDGRVRCLRQSPGRLERPEGLRNFLELCFGSYIQAMSTGCLRIALSWNKTEKKKKKRPFGTDLENGSFRVATLQGLHPGSLESGQIRLTDGPWFTEGILVDQSHAIPQGYQNCLCGALPLPKTKPASPRQWTSFPFPALDTPASLCVTDSAHSEL